MQPLTVQFWQLWDVYQSGKCVRTFMGHSKAVHDVQFDNSGAGFLSSSFDRQMKLWDTETGQLSLSLCSRVSRKLTTSTFLSQ